MSQRMSMHGWILIALAVFAGGEVLAADIGTAFTYQGFLESGAPPAPVDDTCDFRFGLWDAAAGGNQVGTSPQTASAVDVADGVFTLTIDFGADAIDGTARWLEIEVQCPGDPGFVLLLGRVALTPAPHALALPGLYTQQNPTSPNVIGGYAGNSVTAGTAGATIGGGGQFAFENTVTDDYAAIGGGSNNQAGNAAGTTIDAPYATVAGGQNNSASEAHATVGGGESNSASQSHSTVGGGQNNSASASDATVGGGESNSASEIYSTVGGGASNMASGVLSTVGGGVANTATGLRSTIPGGISNQAGGDDSFAAGRRAKANHDGAFVWGDSTDADFTSTAANQFLIRAGGGVGIGTASPASELDVAGAVHASGTITSGNTITIDGTSGSEKISSSASLDLHVAGGRALRLETNGFSPNIIGGYAGNTVTAGALAATISGGGGPFGQSNSVTDNFGSIGGGAINQAGNAAGTTSDRTGATVGGGVFNTASGSSSTIGGGQFNIASETLSTVGGGGSIFSGMGNKASGEYATVSGGEGNIASGKHSTVGGGGSFDSGEIGSTASGEYSTIGGGARNNAFGVFSTVGGGSFNTASGVSSIVPGGADCTASGDNSFAAGRRAKAIHAGAFVWGDSTSADFASTAANQFLIRADGGVGIGTASPTTTLEVRDSSLVVGWPVVITSNFQAGINIKTDGEASSWAIYHVTDDSLAFRDSTTGANRMLIAGGAGTVSMISDGGTTAVINRLTNDGTLISLQQDATQEGVISVSGTTVSYGAFTGSHYGWTDETIARGTLVTLTGDNRRRHDDAGAEPTYGIAPTSTANDPKCLGAYLGLLEPSKAVDAENPHQVMAVGNGDMWVVDTGRNIEPGQYLISSDVGGHAMLDDAERFAVGYVVARAGEGVDWAKVSETVDGRKHKRISVFFESFERGSAVGLGKIVEEQQKRIDELSRRLSELEAAKGGT